MKRLKEYAEAQASWSAETFGPGARLEGVTEHIEKEVSECLRVNGTDVSEWADIAILAVDGANRVGYFASDLASTVEIVAAAPKIEGATCEVIGALIERCAYGARCNGGNIWTWAQIINYAAMGAALAGFSEDDFEAAMFSKLKKNKKRKWPDWRTAGPGPIEHVRDGAAE